MFKFILIVTVTLLSFLSSHAGNHEDIKALCKLVFTENGEVQIHNFQFECDNYGEGASFVSKHGRFKAVAFSEESCTPQLYVYDTKSKTTSVAVNYSNDNGFKAFKDKLVVTALVPDQDFDDILDRNPKPRNRVIMGCSTDKSLLDEFE